MSKLIGHTLEELTEIALSLGFKRFTGAQIAQWIYPKRVSTVEAMTNISKNGRDTIAAKFTVGTTPPLKSAQSSDGTRKYLFHTEAYNPVEAVYIPDNERGTLCVSSQSGCKMGCKFCMTARLGFREQLTAAQIINQFIAIDESERLTNVVFMGMGEPLDNVDNVLRAIEILTSSWGFGWSPTRITLSTIGVLPALEKFLDQSRAHLAVSLHSPFDETRQRLMPMQKAYPIADVVALLRRYDWSGQRRLSFEYILFEGVNDSDADADALVKLLEGLECRINLIRFHRIPDSDLEGSPRIDTFNRRLNAAGLLTTTRSSRGEDILAACGMLAAGEGK